VPYRDINMLEYGQKVSRRYVEAILISPIFLLAKRARTFSRSATRTPRERSRRWYSRSAGTNPKCLVSLEARSGKKVEYQDDKLESREKDEATSRCWSH